MIKNIVYITVVGVLLTACNTKDKQKIAENQVDQSYCLNDHLKQSTQISAISEQDIQEQLTLTGKVEYNENDLVAYKSLLQGTVTQVNFELGDYVPQGKVLAVIKSAEIQGLSQERRSQQNQVELLKKQLATKKELLNDGLASQPEVSEVEYELKSAQIELEKIANTLKMYRSVGDGEFQIVAPKNGYIVQKDLSVGQSISNEGDNNLFSISNLNKVWVMVNIYANNLKYVHVGDEVKVRTVAYPDRIYHGKIDKIYNVFDDDEHVTKARVVLENQDLNLLPGLSADIIIDKGNIEGTAFALPKKSVLFENNKNYVVVYRNDCDMEVRKVTPISHNEEYIYVKEKFSPAEKIISSNSLIIFEELNK